LGTWIRLAVVSLVVIFVIGGILEASAKVFYPSNNYRTSHQPMYCIVQEGVPYTKKDDLMDMAKKAVLEWETKLQLADFTNKALWDMRYKLVDNTSPSCDITIYFKSSFESVDGDETIGFFSQWTKSIGVAFRGWDVGTIYDTILHEIGHSIGLGHYFSDDDEVNLEWLTGDDTAPSIMTPQAHVNPALAIITDVDIWKVQQIYGSLGFYAFSTIPPPQPTPTPTPVPIPTPKPPIVPVFPLDSIGITHEIIEVERYEQQFVKIIGDIKEDVFQRGAPVYLIVKHPDDSFQTLKILTTKEGHFETTLVFDDDSVRGVYKVEASYLEHHDREMDFTFYVVDKGTEIESIIPKFEELPTAPTQPTAPTPTSKSTPLLTMSLFSEGKNLGRSYTVDEGTAVQFAGKLTDEKGNPVRSTTVYITDKYDTKFQKRTTTDQNGHFLYYWGVEPNLKKTVNDKTSWSFFATSQVGSKIITSENAFLMVLQPPSTKLPDWIKNNAEWWSSGKINDKDFAGGIEYMVKEKIIRIPQVESEKEMASFSVEKIPDWIKTNAKWWSEGKISDDDFSKGIEYMIKEGIIRI